MNKYFTKHDEAIQSIGNHKIPHEHWSRKHEYAFALKYVKKNDVVMYASFGHARPLEEYLRANVKQVHDCEESIPDNSIDTIFCIGYLEHEPNRKGMLERFKTVIKNSGKIVITADYPTLNDEDFVALVNAVGLKFIGARGYNARDNDNIQGHYGGLRCYCAVLKKDGGEYEEFERDIKKLETEYEVKIIKPEETKEEKIIPIIPKKRGRKPKK
jgi:hypothetical protein